MTGAFTPSSEPLAHNFRPFRHHAPFHTSAFSQQAAPAPPEAKRLTTKAARSRRGQIPGVRGPAAGGGPGGKGRQAARLGSGSTVPGRTFMNSSLSKQSVSGPLGRFILLFSIPPDAASQRQPQARGRWKTLCVPTWQPQPEPVALTKSATSANMAAAAPRPISKGSAGRPPRHGLRPQ